MKQKEKSNFLPDRYSRLFFALGLLLSLSIVLLAFKWRSYEERADWHPQDLDDMPEAMLEYIPPTVQLPPPPSAQMVEPEEPELLEVPDEKKIEEVIEIQEQDTPPVITLPTTELPQVAPPQEPEEQEPVPIVYVDNRAELMQELNKIRKHVQKNVKYPREAKRRHIQGTVIIQFVLKADGTIGGVEVVRGGDLGDGVLAEEVIRVLKGTGGWKPAKQRGHVVDVTLTMPITFKLK
ncbi:energy transducer TonB [Thermonema rossianum]|uniref:energy transducer TonB n=1 Tax=Thermonema rossianum TaxID=55505 RepID=UPI000571181D|nr:energy transducer TonB [Thermonema rossianum]